MSTKEVPFVAVVAYSNSDCTVAINNKRYVYRSSIPGYKIKETLFKRIFRLGSNRKNTKRNRYGICC